PGPWQLPVIGSLHHLVGALPHHAMRDLALRHGPLMLLRMGELPVVVASSAAAAKEVMKTHDAAFATRPRTDTTASLTADGLGIALAPHGEHWRAVRKLCATELLGAPRVRTFRGTREAEAAALVASVAAEAASGAAVNVSSLVATYVADAAVRAVVGDRIADRDAFLIPTIRAVIRDLIGAGSETSASTLQWAMAELMRNPTALRRAQAEVRGALAGQSRVGEDSMHELPYLRRVIKETLRLHAVAPLLLPRECREPSRVLGYDVPQGAMVLVNVWAIGRDEASWGPDAEEFRPERFEEG
uniref:Cytochrome P450 n=1 Tax=Aegilops tauschii subsp. strangulata TaxID=200361 RepID=A0A453T767_AEGTS